MRRRTARCRTMPFHQNMAFCTIMNTARPQAKDMMMNIGASSAEL